MKRNVLLYFFVCEKKAYRKVNYTMRTMKFWKRKMTLGNREFYSILLQVLLQGESEHSEIGIQILNSSYDFK